MVEDGPDPDAYGRVTNAERYALLHDAARSLVDELCDRYLVERTDDSVDEPMGQWEEGATVIRLVPDDRGAAPIALTLTSFPGVTVRFGRWQSAAFPRCGCDACDEDPLRLVEELRDDVMAVVTGEFREAIKGGFQPGRTYSLGGPRGGHSGWSRLPRREVRRRGGPAATDWRPWPERGPAESAGS